MKPIALVINSNIDQVNSISEVLRNHGMNVISANNGLSGLQCLYSTSPDVIICNYDLPLIHGTDVIKTAKNLKRLEDVPFVFTTDNPNQEAMVIANSLDAAAYIYQPAVSCNLIYTIKKHIPSQLLEIA